ncbi:MAG: hypothetical protein ACOCP4_00730 [Candidatus Woesearchaeota archaeon]
MIYECERCGKIKKTKRSLIRGELEQIGYFFVFVNESYKIVCNKCYYNFYMDNERKQKTIKTYKIGQFFACEDLDKNYLFILAMVDKHRKVALIGFEDGNRWADPISVSDFNAITEEEFDLITGSEPSTNFKQIEVNFEY